EHFMTTSDGYILLIHRIPSNQKGKQGPPVLLGHGSSMGSTGFLLGHPKDHLGYVLADN
ncbi:Gastric triacylglycerol lipaselike, partial [Caligus rogercresseyi]